MTPSPSDAPSPRPLPHPGAVPMVVEVTRGPMVESRHRVSCAVVDADGAAMAAWGDAGAVVYPRSAIKLIQALPFIETGAAEACRAGPAELALACASHGGEPIHVDAVRGWLARLGLGDGDLECGPHYPSHEPSMRAMVAAGEVIENVHNNCSGKHTAMLATAHHMGEATKGYIHIDHPVQKRVAAAIAEMSGCDLRHAPVGIDGCSLPNIALPLQGMARAMARFAAPEALAPRRAEACRRLAAGIVANPLMIAGHDRACSAIIAATEGRAIVKTGAEGVFVAAVPEKGLGVALKVADGAARASQVAVIAVLHHFGVIDEPTWQTLSGFAEPVLRNRRELAVGTIRTAAEGAF